jgi:hypothetical protein
VDIGLYRKAHRYVASTLVPPIKRSSYSDVLPLVALCYVDDQSLRHTIVLREYLARNAVLVSQAYFGIVELGVWVKLPAHGIWIRMAGIMDGSTPLEIR